MTTSLLCINEIEGPARRHRSELEIEGELLDGLVWLAYSCCLEVLFGFLCEQLPLSTAAREELFEDV